jgi:hypothetical protein
MPDDAGTSLKRLRTLFEAEPKVRLIAVLSGYKSGPRDLLKDPPKDDETLQHLGVAASTADRFLRKWINETFRDPNRWPPIARGAIGSDTKFSKLVALCTKA